MEEITINKAQQIVDNWIKTYGVRYFSELTNMAILTEEVGEVARIISRKFGEQSEKKIDVNLENSEGDINQQFIKDKVYAIINEK